VQGKGRTAAAANRVAYDNAVRDMLNKEAKHEVKFHFTRDFNVVARAIPDSVPAAEKAGPFRAATRAKARLH
jgi:hypothetical protein